MGMIIKGHKVSIPAVVGLALFALILIGISNIDDPAKPHIRVSGDDEYHCAILYVYGRSGDEHTETININKWAGGEYSKTLWEENIRYVQVWVPRGIAKIEIYNDTIERSDQGTDVMVVWPSDEA